MKILFLFFFALVSFPIFSQFSYEGFVVDENNKPIPFASMTFRKDSIVYGTTTTFDGGFKIDSISANTYYYRIVYVGYVSIEIEEYTVNKDEIDTIQLLPSPLKVNEVFYHSCHLIPLMNYTSPKIDTLPSHKIPQTVYIHSHNDYLQKFPFKTALEHSVNSIEIDVAWYKNRIKVSHLNLFLKDKPNFEDLYLKPLIANMDSLQSLKFLFIDIKSGGEEILVELNKLIAQYPNIFSTRIEDNSQQIKVVISGAVKRIDLYNNYNLNYLFVDGRPNDLSLNLKTHIMPIISTNYANLNLNERKSLIDLAHAQNKMIRFWNTPNTFKSWNSLLDLKVDILGVDKIRKSSLFLKLFKNLKKKRFPLLKNAL